MRKILLALFCLFLDIITITTAPGSMQGIASGIIETSNTKIPGPPLTYETYDITFGSQLGSNPAAYAFGIFIVIQLWQGFRQLNSKAQRLSE